VTKGSAKFVQKTQKSKKQPTNQPNLPTPSAINKSRENQSMGGSELKVLENWNSRGLLRWRDVNNVKGLLPGPQHHQRPVYQVGLARHAADLGHLIQIRREKKGLDEIPPPKANS